MSGLINPNMFQASPSGGIYNPETSPIGHLKNIPPPLDGRLTISDARQTFNDCHTIEGWMAVIKKIIDASWLPNLDPGLKIEFTHDYGLLPNNPNELAGVITVFETLSRLPAKMDKAGHREVKPRIRQVLESGAQVNVDPNSMRAALAVDQNVTWIWAQSFDVVQMFTIYADTWTRMYEYKDKFEELMTMYAGTFLQGGLQQFWFQQETRDALYDPPKTQAFPNKTLFYFARVERQTKVQLSVIQEVLLSIGLANPVTGIVEPEAVEAVIGSMVGSPIEPGLKAR